MREPFGSYLLVDRIATGGMGEIFLAKLQREQGFEKLVVIKRMLPHLSRNPEFIAMFQVEAKIAAQLSHGNIVHTFDFGREGDAYYIAMEYVHGVDLRTMLHRGEETKRPLALGHVLQIASACCAALDYAHRRCDLSGEPLGIIHRDVSPQNVLVSFEGEVKLTDFGLAKAKLRAGESEAGSLKGKYSYLSPEQVAGRKIDPRCDLFSLGAVLYELCYGERLFPLDDSLMVTLERIRACELPDFATKSPVFPPAMIGLLRRALARDPDARFQSAAEMREEVERIRLAAGEGSSPQALVGYLRRLFPDRAAAPEMVSGDETVIAPQPITKKAPLSDTPTATVAAPTPALRGRRRLGWIAAAVAVVLVAVLAFILWRGEPPAAEPPSPPVGRGPEPAPPVPPAAARRVEVRSTPDGADVFLDDARIAGRTPTVLEAVAPGAHRLRVVKPGYRPYETTLEERGPPLVVARLEPAAKLRVVTVPRGAQVLVDGAAIPGNVLEGLSPGATVRVEARKPGFRATSKVVTLAGPETEARLTLRPAGLVLAITTGERRWRILVDKRSAGLTPLRGRRIEPGVHFVTLLDDERQTEVKMLLRVAKPGEGGGEEIVLNLDASPWARVRIDGSPAGEVPLANRVLRFGSHRIELSRATGGTESLRLRIEIEGVR